MAYAKNATVDSWDTAKQLEYYRANPGEAQQEIARASGIGGSAASDWVSQLRNTAQAPTYTPPGSTSAAQSASYVNSGQALRDSGKTSINGIINHNGSITDTTGMSAQQAYAADLRYRDPVNASKYLSSMGLDMDGNQLSQLRGAAMGVNAASGTTAASTPMGQGGSSAYGGIDIQGMRDRTNQALNLKQQAGLTGIRNARDTALQGYNASETQAKNQAYNKKNQVAGSTALAAKRLSELLASQGIQGGDNLSANARLQSAAQGNLSQIGQTEASLLQDIGQKRNLTNNQAVSQENALVQESEADRINRLLDLDKYGNEQALNLDNINYSRYSDGLDRSFRESQAGIQNRLSEAGLYGYDNTGRQTLQSAAQQFNQGQQQKQFDYQVGRDQVGDQRWDTQFNYQQGRDQIGDQQWQQNFGLNERQANNSFANQANDNELQRLRYLADQDPNSLDNQYKQAQINSLNNKANTPDVAATMKQLESQYLKYDNVGNPSVSDPYAMRKNIIALGLSDGETIKLLQKYNLPVQATNYGGGR